MSNQPTKKMFLDSYKKELQETFSWAQDEIRLQSFMIGVIKTIGYKCKPERVVLLSGQITAENTFKSIGLKGKLTYKALQNLPDE